MPNRLELSNGKKADILEGGRPYLDSLELRLFTANVVPSGTVQPSLGDECTDSGYTAAAPFANTFPTPAATSGTRGATPVSVPTIVFSHGSGDFTVYGVFWTDPADGDATVMSQRMDVPFTCTAAGQVFVISGDFQDDTLTP